MSTEAKPSDIAVQQRASAVERALVQGDLSGLNEGERVVFYRQVCDSLGLNHLTKPFDYIKLNGKLQLYAKKDCTEQLRRIHNISLSIVSREEHDGIYEVTARAKMPSGRIDEDTGAVNVKGLQGEALANAHMKTVTKAKRRVTLSICGLGFLDESEIGSIANAEPALEPAPERPQITHVRKNAPASGKELEEKVTSAEAKAVEAGRCKPGELHEYMRKQGALLGQPDDYTRWSADALAYAPDWFSTFLSLHPAPEKANGTPAQPPPAAAPARYVTPERARAMADLCARKGIGWSEKGPGQKASVCGSRGWARSRMIEDLSQAEYEQLWNDLMAERDQERVMA